LGLVIKKKAQRNVPSFLEFGRSCTVPSNRLSTPSASLSTKTRGSDYQFPDKYPLTDVEICEGAKNEQAQWNKERYLLNLGSSILKGVSHPRGRRPSIEGIPYSKHSVSCIRSDQRLVESHAHHPKGYPPFLERAP
jgi:hypothetical protein